MIKIYSLKNNMDPASDTSMLKTATHRTADDGRTDTDLLGCSPPFRVCELCPHLKGDCVFEVHCQNDF